jgi:hypothetical protein
MYLGTSYAIVPDVTTKETEIMTTTSAYYDATPAAAEPTHIEVTITTEHPLSSYGQPVVIEGETATPAQSYPHALYC